MEFCKRLNYDFKNIEIRAVIIICGHDHSNVQIISKHHSVSEMKEIVFNFRLDEKNSVTEKIAIEINNEITTLLHKHQVRQKLKGIT